MMKIVMTRWNKIKKGPERVRQGKVVTVLLLDVKANQLHLQKHLEQHNQKVERESHHLLTQLLVQHEEDVVEEVYQEEDGEQGVGKAATFKVRENVEAIAENADEDDEGEEDDPDHVWITVWAVGTFKLKLREVEVKPGRGSPGLCVFV